MKKRIGSKLYDTDKAECILPEKKLYKQPKNRTFFTFDGTTITPISFEEAEEIIRGAGDPDLMALFDVKTDPRGYARVAITSEHYNKLSAYARATGRSMKSIIEEFINSLPAE